MKWNGATCFGVIGKLIRTETWLQLTSRGKAIGKQILALADGLIERTSSMLDEIEAETVHNDKKGYW